MKIHTNWPEIGRADAAADGGESAMTQHNTRLQLAIVIGSTRKGRLAPAVAEWFAGVARESGEMAVDVIDLAEARLPEVLSDQPGPEVEAMARRRLAAAEAFVVVTPEYNHSFPAPLKTAIDWHRREWQAKPVGFVSYGGRSGGLRAVEQLPVRGESTFSLRSASRNPLWARVPHISGRRIRSFTTGLRRPAFAELARGDGAGYGELS